MDAASGVGYGEKNRRTEKEQETETEKQEKKGRQLKKAERRNSTGKMSNPKRGSVNDMSMEQLGEKMDKR